MTEPQSGQPLFNIYMETRLKISLTRVMAAMRSTLLNTINYTIRHIVHTAACFDNTKNIL